ncbi:hypothetical protein HBI23_253420 [Parastagonospora nodorum]|nr:hypothetical protein HBI23_253420 [Parastagonospora nodorum]KAH5622310.1 hypothetical protein HBI51_247370 [Parastagonospora nodorum]KAH5983405.1 hypothetical protein HBI84_247340 [Parastagonospora nodorum]KAH6133524.1 hypothetical protein HBI68_252680 [Parastagonospora nodorum]KAH6383664.1 hypothetical protein HBI60_254870 [Parastagonospora nodorum]
MYPAPVAPTAILSSSSLLATFPSQQHLELATFSTTSMQSDDQTPEDPGMPEAATRVHELAKLVYIFHDSNGIFASTGIRW